MRIRACSMAAGIAAGWPRGPGVALLKWGLQRAAGTAVWVLQAPNRKLSSVVWGVKQLRSSRVQTLFASEAVVHGSSLWLSCLCVVPAVLVQCWNAGVQPSRCCTAANGPCCGCVGAQERPGLVLHEEERDLQPCWAWRSALMAEAAMWACVGLAATAALRAGCSTAEITHQRHWICPSLG